MSARSVRLFALPLAASIGMLGLTGVPSHGATTTDGAGGSHASSAKVHKHKKKHHKKHHAIKNKHLGIPTPTPHSGPGVGQVQLTWPKTKGANRYSVLWSPAPYGRWPGATTYVGPKWLPGSARSATLDVNGLGAYQSSPAYGNPVFLDLWADNSRDRAPRHKSRYVAAWPQIAAPAGGFGLRVGTYNLEAGGRGVSGLISNINSQSLDLVAVQETHGGAVTAVLGWRSLNLPNTDEGILFNANKVTCDSARSVGANAMAASCKTADGRSFTFASVHFTGANAATGSAAQSVVNNLGGGNAIVAGDFTSNREPYGSSEQAQPVLVRNGFWDAQASLVRDGVNYSTLNAHAAVTANPSGQGTRADYIMMRGINGSYEYHNMFNLPTVSDHNLVWAGIAIP